MIRDIFEKILFMGSQAVPVIVIVFALRILLYRFHKKYLYLCHDINCSASEILLKSRHNLA